MKIKSDFVTNSSSTCFIVFVPNSYVVSDQDLEDAVAENAKWWDDDDEDQEPMTPVEFKEEVQECIELLKSGQDIYRDNYGDGIDYRVYSLVDHIVSNKGFGLSSIETGGDGLDQIAGVAEEKIIKILTEATDLSTLIEVKK